jgi:hypothetical protein
MTMRRSARGVAAGWLPASMSAASAAALRERNRRDQSEDRECDERALQTHDVSSSGRVYSSRQHDCMLFN